MRAGRRYRKCNNSRYAIEGGEWHTGDNSADDAFAMLQKRPVIRSIPWCLGRIIAVLAPAYRNVG
jgi:hypothetical protein